MGVKKDYKKIKLLQESEIFLLPSLAEGMPLALIEAMAAGAVPILTRSGEQVNFLKQKRNCLYVAKKSPQQINQALSELAENQELREKIRENNLRLIEKEFSQEQFLERLADIFKET